VTPSSNLMVAIAPVSALASATWTAFTPHTRDSVRLTIGAVTAKDVEDASFTRLTVRITYKTRDGDRQQTLVYNLSLFP
jgi:hypothetical protein